MKTLPMLKTILILCCITLPACVHITPHRQQLSSQKSYNFGYQETINNVTLSIKKLQNNDLEVIFDKLDPLFNEYHLLHVSIQNKGNLEYMVGPSNISIQREHIENLCKKTSSDQTIYKIKQVMLVSDQSIYPSCQLDVVIFIPKQELKNSFTIELQSTENSDLNLLFNVLIK